jgi:hypothetical protein
VNKCAFRATNVPTHGGSFSELVFSLAEDTGLPLPEAFPEFQGVSSQVPFDGTETTVLA